MQHDASANVAGFPKHNECDSVPFSTNKVEGLVWPSHYWVV
jgi:hypothetical protein